MTIQTHIHSHLDITDTLARLYLFLAQSMDRCVSETARINYPEAELQTHLASTKAVVLAMLDGNRVVKAKVEQECNRIGSLVNACLMGWASEEVAWEELQAAAGRGWGTQRAMALTGYFSLRSFGRHSETMSMAGYPRLSSGVRRRGQ